MKNVPLASLVHHRIFGGDHQANSTALSTAFEKYKKSLVRRNRH
ncbi:hypothetical protein [Paenibacillus sp. NAIST15-1]|nr:hypothetical protein [Paenibacillus sp. NAIST15-1]